MEFTWTELINKISSLYMAGASENQISSELANCSLRDFGTVERVETDDSPFIQVNMPRIEIPFGKKILIADFLALNFTTLHDEHQFTYRKGAQIKFITKLIESNGPFSGIGVSEDDEDKEILIMVGTRDSEIA